MGIAADGRVVVYMGDDKKDACIYKFVSKGKYDTLKGRSNAALLEEGTLYVANLKSGNGCLLLLKKSQRCCVMRNSKILMGFPPQKKSFLKSSKHKPML